MKTNTCCIVLLALGLVGTSSSLALADDAPPPAPPPSAGQASTQTTSETVTSKGGPSRAMLTSGLVTFGLTYGAGAIVAATSARAADHNMFVPVAGPWMALFNRGDCGGTTGRSCNTETTYKVLIVADGIGQALGAYMIIDAFLNPETRTVSRTTTTASADKPTVRVTPASMGAGGYGVLAVGRF